LDEPACVAQESHKKKELNMKEIDWVQLTKWEDHTNSISLGTMRNIVARRKENGADIFLSLVNGRFYVNLKKFNEWMENQKEKNTSSGKKTYR
jgi:hypothetical protein